MSRKALRTVATTEPTGHPAARAWRALHGARPANVERLRSATRSKPAIYRLTFDRRRAPVFAKHCRAAELALERTIYEEILPRLPVTVPAYGGSLEDVDGSAWLFVEDVGNRVLSARDPGRPVLTAQWLGLLHCSGADLGRTDLPDAGPARYLAHLRAGREAIRRNLGNRGLAPSDQTVLAGVLDLHERLESRWSGLERACEGLPKTFVHGDFRSKNVRMRVLGDVPVLYPIDWEMAGWGIPAADLAGAGAPGLTLPVDPRAYEEIVKERWPDVDASAIRRLAILGRVFQALAAIEWASATLRFESPLCLLKPVMSMRLYVTQIAEALEEATEWLG